MGASDLVGISQGGTDHAISYANFLNGKLITDAGNQPASTMSDGDAFWLSQGGASTLSVGVLLQLAAYLQGKQSGWLRRRVEEASSTNLTFARHNKSLVSFPNGGTVSVAAFSDCGDGFECEVINTSATTLTLGSGITCYGAIVLQPKQAVWIRGVTSNNISVVYAQTPVAAGSTQSINIGALGNQLASTRFTVTGTLTGYGTTPVLSYSNDGGTTWATLPSGSTTTATAFSFSNPGIAANTAASVQVRDGNMLTATSNGFAVESGNFGTLPGFVAGQNAAVPITMAGLTTAYLAWWNGTELGPRISVTNSPVTVTAPAAGSYTLRLFDSSAGGLMLNESASIAVASVAAGLTLPPVASAPSLYIDASNTGQLAGNVTTVADQSGVGNTISAVAGTPTLAVNVQNGKPGLLITGGAVPVDQRSGRAHAGGDDRSSHNLCSGRAA